MRRYELQGGATRSDSTYLVCNGVDIDNELAVDETATQGIDRVFMVWDVYPGNFAICVVSIDLVRQGSKKTVNIAVQSRSQRCCYL